jgi:Ca2+-binding RTX toxin-like protein
MHIDSNQTMTYVVATSDETFILDPNVRMSTTTDPGSFNDTAAASNITFEVAGTIIASSRFSGIFSESKDAHFVIDASGVILAGIGLSLINTSPADINNAGYIGGSFAGLYLVSYSGSIVNSGSIIGTNMGIYFLTSAARASFTIDNDGLIAGDTGINMVAQQATITLGADSQVMGVATGIFNAGTNLTVINDGVIAASGGVAYQGSAGVDNLTNTGKIVGNVNLGDGADRFTESGTGNVVGIVSGGMGDDNFVLSSNKMRVSETNGEGADTVRASASYSIANEGEVENLKLIGKNKLNAIGNEYANTITGNKGANHLDGGAGSDILIGGKGDDLFLFAKGSGDDVINDYLDEHDRIRIIGFDTVRAFKQLVITQDGSNVSIDFGAESATDTVTVHNATVKEFDKGDFIFA